jgi:hypothetical protein
MMPVLAVCGFKLRTSELFMRADCERRDRVRGQNAAAASYTQSVEHRKLHHRSRDRGPTSRRRRFAASSSLEAASEHSDETIRAHFIQ